MPASKPRYLRTTCALAALIAANAPVTAQANDSTAELATGGLRLLQSGAVEMRSEDLSISLKQVLVDYRFFNATDRDVTSIVAFPLPDIAGGEDDNLSIPTQDPANPFAFHTLVNGRPVAIRLEQKAVAGGVDRTAVLSAMHIPLAPYLRATGTALDRAPPQAKATLRRLKLVTSDQDQLFPAWTLKTTYYWSQVFPSRQDVRIQHSYQPSVGGTDQTALGAPGWRRSDGMTSYPRDYCPDATLFATIAHAMKAKRSAYPTYAEQRIDYVLHTGANWSAPIGHFHLSLDKGAPNNLISVCLTGLHKTGPTRFELDRQAFRPATDLKILILTPIS